ncbi:MAG: extracellular solute-binding protein [bacterium]
MRLHIKRLFFTVFASFLVMMMCNMVAYAVEISFWHTGSQDEADAITTVAKDFTQKTGIKVKVQVFSWQESRTKFLTAIAAGMTPDIGTMGSTWPTFFGVKGGMVDLVKEFPNESKKIIDNTFPGAMRPLTYKGSIYGVRYDMTTLLMYVRLDIFKELGLSVPTTWEELTALIPKLKAEGKEFVIGWGNKEWIGAFPFIWQAGGNVYTEDGLKSNLTSPEAVKGLRFFTDLYTKYGMPYAILDAFTGFVTGDFPIMIDGDWITPTLFTQASDITGKWVVSMLPSGPAGNIGFIGGRSMGIFASSKHKKEAMQFLTYITSPEAQKSIFDTIMKEGGGVLLSPNVKAWSIIGLESGYARILKSQLDASQAPRFVIGGDESYQYLNDALNEVILRGDDFDRAMGKADQKTNKQMKSTREELGVR